MSEQETRIASLKVEWQGVDMQYDRTKTDKLFLSFNLVPREHAVQRIPGKLLTQSLAEPILDIIQLGNSIYLQTSTTVYRYTLAEFFSGTAPPVVIPEEVITETSDLVTTETGDQVTLDN